MSSQNTSQTAVVETQNHEEKSLPKSTRATVAVLSEPAQIAIEQAEASRWTSHLSQDIHFGIRLLRRNMGFTAVAVLTLALGIGANTAIFSVLYGVLFKPLPYSDPNAIVRIWQSVRTSGNSKLGMTEGQFISLRQEARSFSNLGAYTFAFSNIAGLEQSERVATAFLTSGVLETFGVQPIVGRTFNTQDEIPGTSSAILSHSYWQRRFGGNPNVIGQTMQVNDKLVNIIGVLPAGFFLPEDFVGTESIQILLPLQINTSAPNWSSWDLQPVARLRPGVSPQSAIAEVSTLFRRIWQDHPIGNNTLQEIGWSVRSMSVCEDIVGDVSTGLWIIAGAVFVVLAIVCANLASLLLARAATRQKEIAIRSALGAQPMRIIRQLLTESMVISLCGGVVGLALAWATIRLIVGLAAGNIPRLTDAGLNLPVLVFTLGACVISALLFGLVPALQAARPNLNKCLRDEGRGVSAGAAKSKIYRALVIAEVASAVILVIGAGLLLRSFDHLLRVDPGFNANNVLTARVNLPPDHYKDNNAVVNFSNELLDRLRALPGVNSVALTSAAPLSGGNLGTIFNIEGRSTELNMAQRVGLVRVTPDYFKTMGIALLRGRGLQESDSASSAPVVVINETMARQYFKVEDPVGKHIRLYSTTSQTGPWAEIVGVAKDVAMRQLNEEHEPRLYFALAQGQQIIPWNFNVVLTVRSSSDPENLAGAIRGQVRSVDSSVPVSQFLTGRQMFEQTTSQPYFDLVLLGLFAAVALILAAVGVYGILANVVRQRTREMGIRLALGASRVQVFRIVIGQGMKLALIGVLIGVISAFAFSHLLSSLLFAVKATDPLTFAGAALLFSVIAFLACYVPAHKAMRVDPMIALRYE